MSGELIGKEAVKEYVMFFRSSFSYKSLFYCLNFIIHIYIELIHHLCFFGRLDK